MLEAARTRRMFSEIAGRYDLLNHLLSFSRDRAWRRRACQMAPAEPGATALDLCAGTGDLALEYLRQYPQVGGLVLADFAEPMLRLARQKAARYQAANVELACVDALQLPFATGAFDLVMCAFGVRNFEHPARGLAEMARVTKPGGSLLVLEFCRSRRQGWARPADWFIDAAVPRLGQAVSGRPGAYAYLRDSVRSFLSPGELAGLLRQAGYDDVQYEHLTWRIVTAFVGRRAAQEAPTCAYSSR